MAPVAKSRAETVALGVLTTLLAALLLGGWTSKESASHHAADIAAVRNERARDSLSLAAKLDRVKDIICEDKPRSHLCK